jgi:hypothetical protein
VSKSAAQVLWPHHKLLPLQGNQKVLLNPGELSSFLDATKASGASARAKRQGLRIPGRAR